MAWLPLGTAIDRRFVLLGPVGFGGVSVVYQAIDAHRGRTIALKILVPTFADDPQIRQKVHREALITDRLRSPSVPRVYDFGDAPLPGGGTVPYVSMELLRGAVLAGRLAGGPLPWVEALTVAATIADVLAIAHRRGVVHRDLTPDNVVLTSSGAKMVDFGEATTVEGISRLVAAHPVPGRRVSGGGTTADDVYALGVLLYQMLTGRSPYAAGTPGIDRAAGRQRRAAPTPVLTIPGMPRVVAEICRACMTKRAPDRPDSASVALALWAVTLRRRPAPAGPAGPPVPSAAARSVPCSIASD